MKLLRKYMMVVVVLGLVGCAPYTYGACDEQLEGFAQASVGYLNAQLFDAVQAGNSKLVGNLLTQRADVNARDEMGETPLVHACKRVLHSRGGSYQVVETLLESKPSVNAKDVFDYTVLENVVHYITFKNGNSSNAWHAFYQPIIVDLVSAGAERFEWQHIAGLPGEVKSCLAQEFERVEAEQRAMAAESSWCGLQ